ncbi:hypothetical protein [Lentzea sp. NBRC 102530]|uniref:hypothetical protein n=1 Tax=Lentzea sp. NBRC 102530 TaxID=3032201 RepID=UPI0024A47A94|nr:hypothetical protein [Lentzea sp. NBRC 102530]GLY52752.1 hypothetical protein Lesp01_64080 [Lentzea sp. NBRC 102530]
MNDTEQRIKEALGLLAERTPHPGPTLNALRRKRKRQRNNIFLLATAGVAAVAVLIFAGVIASDRYVPPNPNDAGAALVPAVPGALKYQPHWLPEGFVEGGRTVQDGVTTRVWVPEGSPRNAASNGDKSIELASGANHAETGGWQDVSVRGLQGKARVVDLPAGTTAEVRWKAQDALVVSVRGVSGDLRETALRIADSVRADSKDVFQPPFRLAGKPATEFWGAAADEWVADIETERARVEVFSGVVRFQGRETPIAVRGKQGFVEDGGLGVQEGEVGIIVHPVNGTPVEELVEIANQVELLQADTGWIRKR